MFGKTLYVDNRIEVANAYITNKPAIEAAFEDVQAQIDNLVASRDELSDKIDEAGKAVKAAEEAVDELNADSWTEYNELQRQNNVADAMITAISEAALATVLLKPSSTLRKLSMKLSRLSKIRLRKLKIAYPALKRHWQELNMCLTSMRSNL